MSEWRPRKVTAVPGPKSIALRDRAARVLNHGTCEYTLVKFVQGRKEAFLVEDVDGNEYVDCLSAWGADPYGSANPLVSAAMFDSWQRHGAQISVSVLSEPVIELAERLVGLAPASLSRAEFSVTGTQAVESAVRLMRESTGRPYVIVLGPVYHGNSTVFTAAASSDTTDVSVGANTFVNGILTLPFPGTLESPFRPDEPGNNTDTLHYLRNWVLRYQIAPHLIAGVLIEPIITEGGVVAPSQEFWDNLAVICEEHDWVLAVDEVQTGMGRCGSVFAIDRWGVQPDILILGKGLSGGGMPIAAILGSERVMGYSELTQGSTFGWQPAACAAALAGIDILTDGATLPHVRQMEDAALRILSPLLSLPHVTRVSAYGAEVAVEYEIGSRLKQAYAFTDAVHARLLEDGVLGMGDGEKNFYRFQPPLLLPMDWEYALKALARAITVTPHPVLIN